MRTKEKTRQVLLPAAGMQMGLYFVFELDIVIQKLRDSLGQRHCPLRQSTVPGYMLTVPPADGFSPAQWPLCFGIPSQAAFLTVDVRTSCELPAADLLLTLKKIAGKLLSPSRLELECSLVALSLTRPPTWLQDGFGKPCSWQAEPTRTLSFLSVCEEGHVEGKCSVGTREAKARVMAPHDEGKGTQCMGNLNGLGVRISGLHNHPCEALRHVSSEDFERDCGVNGDLQK